MLEGMKVLSFVHGLYGCGASQILADLGADVVRVEWDPENRGRPGSDYRKNG
ncbi:MAG: CoA transferase, partial [Anaerotruncus rubiinfantis]